MGMQTYPGRERCVFVCVCVVGGGHSVYKTDDFVQHLKEE